MATRRLLSAYLVFILLSCLLKKGHGVDRMEATEKNHYHSVEISSLLPPSVCNPSTKGSSNRKASLEVVHRHGPCSQLSQDKPNNQPTLAEILSHDQSRVKSIQARYAFNSDMLTNKLRDKKTILPAQRGISLGSLNYLVTIGVGTPKKDLSLIFDTGSDITWTQCEPCVRYCYNQKQEKLDPAKSSTYSNITCNSPLCSQLQSATGITPGCSKSTCIYGIRYGDQSFSVGFFAKEKLTLSSTDVLDNIPLGCGQNNRGLFGTTSGLIGLGRHPLSIVSQTAAKYGKFFSYCLPSTGGSGGHLTFGKNGVSKRVKYSPLANSTDNTFYVINIMAISVGGRKLPISASVLRNAGTIIDSGTVVTRLPTLVYKPLRDAFKQQMTMYKTAQPISIFDTCYDLSNYTSVKIPTISFYFTGNVKVDVVPDGILIVANGASQVCLAFAEDDSLSILGNLQQQTYEVVYDVAGGKLGFAPGGCA